MLEKRPEFAEYVTEAMDAEMCGCGDQALRDAYFAINPAYKAARSDLFRPWVLYKFGGMSLDLRGCMYAWRNQRRC